ncbi:MAG: response regulator [Planctomycetota bacterium]
MSKILVADEDAGALEGIAAALESAGHEVTRARNGGQAREALTQETFALLVTDLEMPVLKVMDLLSLVRAQPNPIPVIVVSASGSREERRKARAVGAAALVERGAPHLIGLVREVERLTQQVGGGHG